MDYQKPEKYNDWKRKKAARKPIQQVGKRLLSVSDLIIKFGVCRTTIYNWRKSGSFPTGRKLPGSNLVRWSESAVDEWMTKEGF